MDVRFDKATFKALSSEERIDVLKLLQGRRHTQSELALSLGISAPSMKEHLEALQKAELIERFDEGRKWKYFGLTRKGKAVLAPEQTRIWIVLGLWVLSLAGGIMTYVRMLLAPEPSVMAQTAMAPMKAAALAPVAESAPIIGPSLLPYFVAAIVIFTLVLIVLLFRSYRYKRGLGKHLSKK